MKIAILEPDPHARTATGVRGKAIQELLRGRGHDIDVLTLTPEMERRVAARRRGLIPRIARHLGVQTKFLHPWDAVADEIEPVVRRGAYDAVVGRGQDLSYVFTRPLGRLRRVVDMPNIWFLEGYYQWSANYREVEETFRREQSVLEAADVVVLPSRHLVSAVVEAFPQSKGLKDRVVVAPLGCHRPSVRARWRMPPRIVYAGSYYYIQDPYLLSRLSRDVPGTIDCYGAVNPNHGFLPAALCYRGFAPNEDFMADYQFGLICVARDWLRMKSPATKLPYYFSYGLPVLFPEWMEEGHDYPECAIPYREDSFERCVSRASQPDRWETMSAAALKQARELTWETTLEPLVVALESGIAVSPSPSPGSSSAGPGTG